jgi:hypothetical protein
MYAYIRDENELKKKEEFLRWKDKKDAEIKERERIEVFICVYVYCVYVYKVIDIHVCR